MYSLTWVLIDKIDRYHFQNLCVEFIQYGGLVNRNAISLAVKRSSHLNCHVLVIGIYSRAHETDGFQRHFNPKTAESDQSRRCYGRL